MLTPSDPKQSLIDISLPLNQLTNCFEKTPLGLRLLELCFKSKKRIPYSAFILQLDSTIKEKRSILVWLPTSIKDKLQKNDPLNQHESKIQSFLCMNLKPK
jgi:hypothetical protein